MNINLGKTTLVLGLLSSAALSLPQTAVAANVGMTQAVQQSKRITGTVSDKMGTLIGATIMEKGTKNGTVTDLDGHFTLNVKPGATLIVSYVGYDEQEVPVGSNSNLNITLKEHGRSLNEVVVIGYGTQRREAVTGSVANVGGEDLKAHPINQGD